MSYALDGEKVPVSMDDEATIKQQIQAIMRYKWRILLFSVFVSSLVAFFVTSMKPIYSSSSTVLIEGEKKKVLSSIEDVYEINTSAKEYFLTQFEILKSRELTARVVKQLDLVNHPEFAAFRKDAGSEAEPGILGRVLSSFSSSSSSTSERNDSAVIDEQEFFELIVDTVSKNTKIIPVPNTQVVKLSYESHDRKLAAAVPNTLSEVYIASYLEERSNVTDGASDSLSQRVKALRENLEVSEAKLQSFKESERLVDIAGVKTLSALELDDLTTRLLEAKNRQSEASNILAQVSAKGGDTDSLMSISAVANDALVQRFKADEADAEKSVAELSKRYGPKHPKMIAAQADYNSARASLDSQVKKAITALEREKDISQQQIREIELQLAQAKQGVLNISGKEAQLKILEQEVESNRELYEMVLNRSKETLEASVFNGAAHARVIDRAVVPREPVKPKKGMLIALALVGSLFIGVLLAAVAALMDNTVKGASEIEDKLNVPVLGKLPKVKAPPKGVVTNFMSEKNGVFAEAVRTIRSAFLLAGASRRGKITVVTSAEQGEGKTTVALNLAVAMGQLEKVLLIEADMRTPSLSDDLGLPNKDSGLSSIMTGAASLGASVNHSKNSNLSLISAGPVPTNPLEMLSSKRFAKLLQTLEPHYDRIVIDTAPVSEVSDALVLSTYADGVIVTVKSQQSTNNSIASCLRKLREVGAPIAGIVLNQVEMDTKSAFQAQYEKALPDKETYIAADEKRKLSSPEPEPMTADVEDLELHRKRAV